MPLSFFSSPHFRGRGSGKSMSQNKTPSAIPQVPSSALATGPLAAGNSKSNGSSKQTFNGKFHNYRGTLLLALFALVLWLNISFIKPLVMGAIFAAALYPIMEKLGRWKIGKGWRATLITLGF